MIRPKYNLAHLLAIIDKYNKNKQLLMSYISAHSEQAGIYRKGFLAHAANG